MLERARWIWDAPNAQTAAPAGDRFFRATFTVPAGRKITRALSVIGADNTADVYLNGEPIAVESKLPLPAPVDITHLLRPGENVIAVRATHTRADRPAGLIGAVRIEFASGDPILSRPSNRGARS